MKLIKAHVQFAVNGKRKKFYVIHNLPKAFGLNFDCAFDNWLARTDKYTASSLCEYIISKRQDAVCMTIAQYNRISKLGT